MGRSRKEQWPQKLLFQYSTCDCRYFKWCKKFPYEECPLHDDGESIGITNGGEHEDDLSHMLKMLAKLSKENDLEISLQINIRKRKQVSGNVI